MSAKPAAIGRKATDPPLSSDPGSVENCGFLWASLQETLIEMEARNLTNVRLSDHGWFHELGLSTHGNPLREGNR